MAVLWALDICNHDEVLCAKIDAATMRLHSGQVLSDSGSFVQGLWQAWQDAYAAAVTLLEDRFGCTTAVERESNCAFRQTDPCRLRC